MAKNELQKDENTSVGIQQEAAIGFEYVEESDLSLPRVKCTNALSPEVKDKDNKIQAGEIINSVSLEIMTDKRFVPVIFYKKRMKWNPREEGGGINCRSIDKNRAKDSEGNDHICSTCRQHLFDNTKEGKEAYPTCTEYLCFLGFFKDDLMPIELSFSKTNTKEGKKILQQLICRNQNIWNFSFMLSVTEKSANGNDWYVIQPKALEPTDEDEREHAKAMYKQYAGKLFQIETNLEDTSASEASEPVDVNSTEY